MKIIKKIFNGIIVFQTDLFEDKRGSFTESFNKKTFEKKILKQKINFVQDNISISKKNVFRGFHFQTKPFAQGKLVKVLKGEILDIVIDLRRRSKYFGKNFQIKLNDLNNYQIWIPEGFAHGFISLKDNTKVMYKTTNYYQPKCERTLVYNDSNIQMNFLNKLKLYISKKDLIGLNILEIKKKKFFD